LGVLPIIDVAARSRVKGFDVDDGRPILREDNRKADAQEARKLTWR